MTRACFGTPFVALHARDRVRGFKLKNLLVQNIDNIFLNREFALRFFCMQIKCCETFFVQFFMLRWKKKYFAITLEIE